MHEKPQFFAWQTPIPLLLNSNVNFLKNSSKIVSLLLDIKLFLQYQDRNQVAVCSGVNGKKKVEDEKKVKGYS